MQRDFWFHCLRVGLFQSSHSVASPLPPPSVQPPAPNDESRSLRNMVHQLIDVCCANQSHLTGFREEVATLRSLVNTLVARPFTPPAQVHRSSARSSSVEGQADWTPAPCLPPRRLFCSSSERCRVRFCQDHCTSPRCNVHARQTRSQERHCCFRGCQARVPAECSSGFCDEHCSSPEGAFCIVPALIVHSTVAHMAGGREPGQRRTVIPMTDSEF